MRRGSPVPVRGRVSWASVGEAEPRKGPRTAGDEPDRPVEHGLSAAADEVHRFVARRVANHADAADIAQQTLLQALSRWGSCRAVSHRPWLYAIARHLIVDHYRARARFRFVEAGALAGAEPTLQTRPDSVHEGCVARERMSCLQGCLTQRLPVEEQVAVLLADLHGHRDKESAGIVGMSLPSFKLLLHGARARLQETAGGSCLLVGKTTGTACERPANGRQYRGCEPVRNEAPARRAGVVCPLGREKLLALRRRLLDGLKLSGLFQLVTDALLDAEPLLEVVAAFG